MDFKLPKLGKGKKPGYVPNFDLPEIPRFGKNGKLLPGLDLPEMPKFDKNGALKGKGAIAQKLTPVGKFARGGPIGIAAGVAGVAWPAAWQFGDKLGGTYKFADGSTSVKKGKYTGGAAAGPATGGFASPRGAGGAGDPMGLFGQYAGSAPSGSSYSRSPELAQGYKQMQADINREKARVNAEFGAQQAEIRKRARLAETAEEKAALTFALADLEAQKNAGIKAVDTSFNRGYTEGIGLAKDAKANTKGDQQRVEETWFRAAGAIGDDNAAVRNIKGGASGLGLSALPVSGAGADAAQYMANVGASQSVFQGQLNDILAANLTTQTQALRQQQGAQQGALQRANQKTRNNSIMTHNEKVQDRITREYELMNSALDNLFNSRQGVLGDLGKEGRSTTGQYFSAEAGRRDNVDTENRADRRAYEADRRDLAKNIALKQWEKAQEKAEAGAGVDVTGTKFYNSLAPLLTDGGTVDYPTGQFDKNGNAVTEKIPVGQAASQLLVIGQSVAGLPRNEARIQLTTAIGKMTAQDKYALSQKLANAGYNMSPDSILDFLNGTGK